MLVYGMIYQDSQKRVPTRRAKPLFENARLFQCSYHSANCVQEVMHSVG